MKKHFLTALAIISVFSVTVLSSCHMSCIKGSGHVVTETRKQSNFSKIDISGGFKINLKQDSSLAVSVTGDDNLMKYIRTEVSGDKLRIFTRKNFCNEKEVVVNIGVKAISEIKGSGAVELNGEGRINVKDLVMHFSGASKINLDLSAANVTTETTGATEIFLKGQAASHIVHTSGVSKLYAFDFPTGTYKLQTSGASKSQINVLNSLTTNTSGVADIEYKGNPPTVDLHKSGASNVKKVQ